MKKLNFIQNLILLKTNFKNRNTIVNSSRIEILYQIFLKKWGQKLISQRNNSGKLSCYGTDIVASKDWLVWHFCFDKIFRAKFHDMIGWSVSKLWKCQNVAQLNTYTPTLFSFFFFLFYMAHLVSTLYAIVSFTKKF